MDIGLLARLLLGGGHEWLSFHIDDDAPFGRKLIEWAIRNDLDPAASRPVYEELFWQVPLVLTVKSDNVERVSRLFTDLWRGALAESEKGVRQRKYRDVIIREAPVDASRYRLTVEFVKGWLDKLHDQPEFGLIASMLRLFPDKVAPKAFYAASVGKEYYLSWSETALRRAIDRALSRKVKPGGEEVNAALRLSARGKTASTLQGYLEWQTHRQALSSVAIWEALRRAGLDPKKPAEVRRLLGYVPISPDGSAFEVDKQLDEVRNVRHGSLSRPVAHDMPAADSRVAVLLRQIKGLGVQLRFREDGVHTILTMERQAK
jgi:hypothetical protein